MTRTTGVLVALLFLLPSALFAWPTESQWIELVKGSSPLSDPVTDAQGSRNVVPDDGTNAAAYIYNDGTYLFYRIRLDADPTGTGGQGELKPYGWGFELDTNQDASDYEWIIMCDGISSPEIVALRENTEKKGLGDPSDLAEYIAAQYPLSGNHRVSLAPTSINGDPDYFLDFRIPYAVVLLETGITEDTLVRYFVGSSSAANTLTENGADLVGGSSLYDGLTNYTTPTGELPPGITFTDGAVRYVEDLDGFGDVYLAAAGDTLFIRVDDADQTADTNPARTLTVEIITQAGDREYVVLSATGVSGKFTGSLGSTQVATVSISNKDPLSDTNDDLYDGILQVVPDEVATVTYFDAITADGSQNVERTDTVLFTAAATDLALTKSADKTIVQQDETVRFTVTLENKGPSDATGVTVTDLLPAGIAYNAATVSQGSYDDITGVWTVGTVVDNGSATLTLDTRVTAAGGSVANNASISALDQVDGYGGNDSAVATVYVGGTDLRLTKTVDNPYPAELDIVTFTVRILNLGPGDATGVTVTDLLPAGELAYAASIGYSASQGTYDSATGLWSVGALAKGEGAQLTLPAEVLAGTADTIVTNTAALTGVTEAEINSANDSASADVMVNFHDLALRKEVALAPAYSPFGDSAAPNEGDPVRYLVTLTNNGPNDATGIEVTDVLPSGLSYNSATVSLGSYSSASGLWTVGDLASGASETLQIDARVLGSTAGLTIINTADISAADHPDDDPLNNSANATITVAGTDLALSKSASNPTPAPGGAVTYTVTLTNKGPNRADNVQVTDIEPGGVSFDSSSATHGSYDGSGGNPSYIWSVGTLNVGETATLTIVASVDSGTSGQTINNVAMITGSDQEDSNTINNVASAQIAVDGTDLGIVKTVDDSTPNEGDRVTYTLTLSNHGPSDATGVEVSDLLPPELTYNSVVAASGYDAATGTWDAGNGYDPASGIWTVGSEHTYNAATATLQITADVKTETSGLTITNTAAVTGSNQGDQNGANDSAAVDINVAGTDLQIAKTVDDGAPGELNTVTYTLTVTNTGSNGASGIEVEDPLPSGVTYISDTPGQGSYDELSGSWVVGSLAAGASATLDILAGVNSGTSGSTITNTAYLTAADQPDDNADNDSASVDIVPIIAPSITLVKSVANLTDSFHLPGSIMQYTITATNFGGGTTDYNSVVITDAIPEHTDLVVTDDPIVSFSYSDPDSGNAQELTYDSATDLCFSAAACPVTPGDCSDAAFGYAPADDGNGTDSSVSCLRVAPQGTFEGAAASGNPSFTIRFKVRIE